jgi:hypothetical protein
MVQDRRLLGGRDWGDWSRLVIRGEDGNLSYYTLSAMLDFQGTDVRLKTF